tara:strand:- start:528 stop:773 length:246 start_codon:yes stop_codon:yes gene_type:complete
MKMAEAKQTFINGGLVSVFIVPAAMRKGWCVIIRPRLGDDSVLTSFRGETRWFRLIDAAYKAIEEIGFSSATIRTFPPQHD